MKNSTILFPVHARWKIGRRALRSIYMVKLAKVIGHSSFETEASTYEDKNSG